MAEYFSEMFVLCISVINSCGMIVSHSVQSITPVLEVSYTLVTGDSSKCRELLHKL